MEDIKIIKECVGFDWEVANFEKNWLSHQVSSGECEQVFFNRPILLQDDVTHSQTEKRYYVLGRTDDFRELFIVFTIRNNLIRVISARDMSKKERQIYDHVEDIEEIT